MLPSLVVGPKLFADHEQYICVIDQEIKVLKAEYLLAKFVFKFSLKTPKNEANIQLS